jgi:hypothetical protein
LDGQPQANEARSDHNHRGNQGSHGSEDERAALVRTDGPSIVGRWPPRAAYSTELRNIHAAFSCAETRAVSRSAVA